MVRQVVRIPIDQAIIHIILSLLIIMDCIGTENAVILLYFFIHSGGELACRNSILLVAQFSLSHHAFKASKRTALWWKSLITRFDNYCIYPSLFKHSKSGGIDSYYWPSYRWWIRHRVIHTTHSCVVELYIVTIAVAHEVHKVNRRAGMNSTRLIYIAYLIQISASCVSTVDFIIQNKLKKQKLKIFLKGKNWRQRRACAEQSVQNLISSNIATPTCLLWQMNAHFSHSISFISKWILMGLGSVGVALLLVITPEVT